MNLEQLERAEAEAEKLLNPVPEGDEDKGTEETTTKTKVEETQELATPEPEAVVVEPTKEVPVKEVTPPVKSEDFEQKYRTLEGKYKAEIPRYQQEASDLREKLRVANTQLAELQEKINSSQTAKASEEIDADLQSLSEIDPRVATVVSKIKKDYDEKVKNLEKKVGKGIEDKNRSVETDIDSIRLMRFDEEMKAFGVPDWKEIDVDPKFAEFLSEPLAYTGHTKLEHLKAAADQRNAKIAAQFFLDYKKSLPPVKEDNKGNLTKNLAPPKGGSSAPAVKPGQPTGLTRESYTKFMNDTARGKYNPKQWGGKTEEQMDEIFDKAIAAGELQ